MTNKQDIPWYYQQFPNSELFEYEGEEPSDNDVPDDWFHHAPEPDQK